MQNLLGKMANLMTSVLQRSTPSSSEKADEMKLLVVDCRTHLTNAIYEGKDCVEVIKRLTELDCPLYDKYAVLQVTELLTFNSQSFEELKHILVGLAAIVKYAQHLIKRSEHRRDHWRIIHFSNAVVQKKIRPMKGFETVLQQLGYTIVSPNGLCFPNGVEPNTMVIINLIADMMLFRKEIKEYILDRHLHPKYLQMYIPLVTQQEIQRALLSEPKCEDEDFSEASSSQISPIVPGQLGDKPTQAAGQYSNLNASHTQDAQLASQSGRTQLECNNNSVANDKFQTAIPVSTSVDYSVACESPAVGNLKEPECETEQFQSAAEQVQAIQDLVTPTSDQDTVVTESSSGLNSSLRLACTVCGDEAVVFCEECTKKPLCQSCNTNWHKHPGRQGHNQKCISALDFASPESANPVHIDGLYGISAQTITNPDRMGQKQQTHLVKQKALNKTNSANHKQYSPELPNRFLDNEGDMNTMDFYLPNQMKNEQAKLPDHHMLQSMSSQQQHYPPPLHYPHLAAAGFDSHSAPYLSQVPYYNNNRLVYPGQGQGYTHSPLHPGHQFRPGMENFNPRMPQKQLFDNSELMNSYHPEVRAQHPHNLPYLQQQLSDPQQQAALLQLQQQQPGWHFQGMANRTHNPYPYNPDLAHSQHMEDFSPASYIPTSIMNGTMFQHTSPNAMHQSTNQFPLSLQHDTRPNNVGQFTRNSQLVHQGTLLPGKHDAQMNNQVAYNPTSFGHAFHPTTLDVHQMSAPGMYGGNQDSMSHYQMMSVTKPTYMTAQKHLASSTSSPSLSSIFNPIFEQLKQLPNIEVQSAKCDEHIAVLVRDIKVLEQQINSAMEADVEVCETEEFRTWNRQKALLMQQKKLLEEYRHQLENETALMKMNSEEEVQQQIHYPPEIDLTVRTANKKLAVPVSSSEKVPNVATSGESVALSDVPDHRPTSSNTNNSAAATSVSPAMLKPSQSSRKAEDKPHSTAASSSQTLIKDNASDISNMNKVSSRDNQKPPSAVAVAGNKRATVQNSPPPLPQRVPQVVDILNKTFPPPKAMPVASIKDWPCQHCTYLNPAGSRFCAMCDTHVDPLLIGMSHDDTNNEDNNFNETQDNLMRRSRFLDLLEEIKAGEHNEKAEGKFQQHDDDDDKQHAEQSRTIGSRICGSQEQVMIEKKKAQQEFIHQQQETESRRMSAPGLHSSAPIRIKGSSPVPSTTSSSYNTEQKQQPPSSHKQGVEINEHYSPGSSDYHTPPSTVSPSPSPQPSTQYQTANVDSLNNEDKLVSLGSCDSTLEDTLARFNEMSMIDSMKSQGAEFAKLIKMADREGFNVEAVQIAQSYSDVQNVGPIEWLKQNWMKNVNMVAAMAVTAGNKQQQNTVGELSVQEAESAYISCHGNMKDAVQLCVSKRTELYTQLGDLGDYPREEILQVMFQCCGDREAAERLLIESNLRPYVENIWAEKETDARNRFAFDLSGPLPDMCHSFSTSIIFHGDFQKMIKDKSLDRDRRIRMIFVEGTLRSWGRAELVIRILDNDLPDENISLEDVVEAVRNCQDRSSALAYLQQECALCFTNFPMSKIRSLNICQCKMCEQCLTKNFEIGIREKHVRHWTCPLCSLPDMNDTDVASDYLHFLLLLLQPLIDKDLQNLFEVKVRDWHLQKDISFRWCAHCAEGFLAENQGQHLRMTCPHCQKKTCFHCKKQWEPQHEGLTCEQFAQWKIENDPSNQSEGLAKHLDENGIDCPTCKMRFALAKGGCMHFKCPQCGHEFCSGCNEPFHQKDVCNKFTICKKLGLHCHCPRDCFSYLRDRSVQQLQQLLKMHDVHFNVNTPEDQTDPLHCPVMEQKEFELGKKDEKCGKETLREQAGLCEIHYKEYLVYIINRHKLDPVVLMTKEEMAILLSRYDIQSPNQNPNETPEAYVTHLIKVIQEDLPLR